MDRIEQRLRVAPKAPPQRAQDERNGRSGRHSPRDVSPHSLGPGDTLPDAETVIFSILPILAILVMLLPFAELIMPTPPRMPPSPDTRASSTW